MKPEWCPQWAWDEADRLADVSSKYWHDIYWNGRSDITLNEHVARALLEAHQRGRREGLGEAADYVAGTGGVIPGASVYAPIVSGNNQPCASGDPRDRIPNLLRRRFDYATSSLAQAIRAKAQEVKT